MSKKLVILESPTKAKKVQEFLGDEYIVKSSMGHIADLNHKFGFGVDINNNFKSYYSLLDDKLKTVEELFNLASNCESIFLLTDPDREGESIAWHLYERLKDLKKPIKRITVKEITKKAVLNSFKEARDIDLKLFKAQEARRVLDRLVGFTASPYLIHCFGTGNSSGRVQSPVAKLIIEREEEINNFKPKEYWNIFLTLKTSKNEIFTVKYDKEVNNKEQAEEIKQNLIKCEYLVLKCQSVEEKKKPNPPLITSTLQQIMSKNFNLSPDRTMKAAQSLYENGHISYMRTDSVRLEPEYIEEIRDYLKTKNLDTSSTPNLFKNKNLSQDAHTAISPTHLDFSPKNNENGYSSNLSEDEILVYNEIKKYCLASQMPPAVFLVSKIIVSDKENKYIFKTSGKSLKYDGYLKLMNYSESKIDLPYLINNQELFLIEKDPVKIEQKFTQPPARYSEATLIETLEKKNIGRPSTFADLLTKVSDRKYVEKNGNVYKPTELGKKIINDLNKYFSFLNYSFTSNLEDKLDEIADGKADYFTVISTFFNTLKSELSCAYLDHGSKICPKCGFAMINKKNKQGEEFLGCINFRNCVKNKKPDII